MILSHQRHLASINSWLPRIDFSTSSSKGEVAGLGVGDGRYVIKHHHTIRSREVEVYPITGFHAEDIHPEDQGG